MIVDLKAVGFQVLYPCLAATAIGVAVHLDGNGVGGLREAALALNWRLPVRGLGKFKTVVQCLAIAIALADLSFTVLGLRPAPVTLVSPLLIGPLWAAAAVSWLSAVDYMRIFFNRP